MEIKTPQQGIVLAVIGKINNKEKISEELKDKFWNCLNWVIENEKDEKILSWAYYTRGQCHQEGRDNYFR